MQNKYEQLAESIFFSGGHIPTLLVKHGLQLKEGKSFAEIKAAFADGMRKGAGKIEREMMCCGNELKKVLEEVK